MRFSAIIERELEALRRDRARQGRTSTLDDVFSELEDYPSIVTRFNRVIGTIHRGKDSVLSFPSTVKHFIHRGRYGWATPDTWSMDYTLAKQLDGVFREFARVSCAYPVDQDPDECNKMILEIADGFREYWQFEERNWNGEVRGDTLEEQIAAERKDFEIAMTKVRRSFELMGEHWSKFWW